MTILQKIKISGQYGKGLYIVSAIMTLAASVGHTTDLVHSLQAGKTVDISRCASEINRLAFRLPHCFGHVVACSFSRPPALRRAEYQCQSADADLPPVRFPNPCRLRRHPLTGELPASRPVSPVIVLPLWIVMILQVVIGMPDEVNRSASACVVISV